MNRINIPEPGGSKTRLQIQAGPATLSFTAFSGRKTKLIPAEWLIRDVLIRIRVQKNSIHTERVRVHQF